MLKAFESFEDFVESISKIRLPWQFTTSELEEMFVKIRALEIETGTQFVMQTQNVLECFRIYRTIEEAFESCGVNMPKALPEKQKIACLKEKFFVFEQRVGDDDQKYIVVFDPRYFNKISDYI